jgi:glycosyltransferase involved in cell wall biosynthesis
MTSRPLRILHIIQQVSRGGASRAMLNLAKYSAQTGDFRHQIVSLVPADASALLLARTAGAAVLDHPDRGSLCQVMQEADIVQVHFWNSPELYTFLCTEQPASRMLAWIAVAGDQPPHMLTEALCQSMDFVVAGCPYTAELAAFAQCSLGTPRSVVWPSPDFTRLSGLAPRLHSGFNIGYIGTVDFSKMHPAYVAMSAAVQVPEARFIVCGGGKDVPVLKQQIERAGAAGRFALRGYVENIRPFFETLDVLGYPLCPETYAGAELVVQEAMYAGVPPVIFAYGGAQRTVMHEETGLVVSSEAAYIAALEYLYHHPNERRRLGENARAFARRAFGAEKAARAMNKIYLQMLDKPKQRHPWPGGALSGSGASRFIGSLGGAAPQFQASLDGADIALILQAEALIRCSPPVLASAAGGGVLHYRLAYPSDPHLRLWAGLVLLEQGRPALAAAEFAAARKLSLSHWRVDWYQAQAASRAGAPELARALARQVREAAPGFEPAIQFLNGNPVHAVD